jgi:hypothetical protein
MIVVQHWWNLVLRMHKLLCNAILCETQLTAFETKTTVSFPLGGRFSQVEEICLHEFLDRAWSSTFQFRHSFLSVQSPHLISRYAGEFLRHKMNWSVHTFESAEIHCGSQRLTHLAYIIRPPPRQSVKKEQQYNEFITAEETYFWWEVISMRNTNIWGPDEPLVKIESYIKP